MLGYTGQYVVKGGFHVGTVQSRRFNKGQAVAFGKSPGLIRGYRTQVPQVGLVSHLKKRKPKIAKCYNLLEMTSRHKAQSDESHNTYTIGQYLILDLRLSYYYINLEKYLV